MNKITYQENVNLMNYTYKYKKYKNKYNLLKVLRGGMISKEINNIEDFVSTVINGSAYYHLIDSKNQGIYLNILEKIYSDISEKKYSNKEKDSDEKIDPNERKLCFIGFGTTKRVFSISTNECLKILLCNIESCHRFIKEPIYMLKNADICNKPSNIKIYCSSKIILDTDCILEHIIDESYGDKVIITWIEERAKITGLTNFVNLPDYEEKFIDDGKNFIKETTDRLKENKFGDLGEVNIGYFTNPPHYRWIDIQPIE